MVLDGPEDWADALPDEIWALVLARLDDARASPLDVDTRRAWVQAWCRCAQTCRKFRGLFRELSPMEHFSHANWPRLSRRLAGSDGEAYDAVAQMEALSMEDASSAGASSVDWVDVVSVQMRQAARLQSGYGGLDTETGPSLVRLSRQQPCGAVPGGHKEWVTCTKFFPGRLPQHPSAGGEGAEGSERAGQTFGSASIRGALGGQTGLVSCSYDGTIRFWDLSQHSSYRETEDALLGRIADGGIRCCHEFQPHREHPGATNLFSCLAFDEDAGVIAAGDIHDNSIKRWVLNDTGAAARNLGWAVSTPFTPISAPIGLKDCIDLNDRLLVVGCEDGRIRMYPPDQERPELLGTLLGHSPDQMISCVKLLGDGSYALSASGDKTIRLWDIEAQRSTMSMSGHGREIFCCDTDRHAPGGQGGNLVISGGRDKTARVWDRRTGDCEHVLQGHEGTVVCLRFDDMLLATAGGKSF
jgi:hypothetical protein